jgi:predicted NBD/HSP70 family sugar kinase
VTRVVGVVDWGGTWIRVALVGGDRILHRERTPRPGPLPDQYAAIASLLDRCAIAVRTQPHAVGVGVAGIVQHGVVMTAINIGIATPTDVRRDLANRLDRSVVVVNDLQAAAMGLAARWPDGLTAVISMGTGVGGAVIDRGELLAGNGGAGDFGHIVLDVDGPRCLCGGVGCLETLASGKVLAEAAAGLATSGQSVLLAARAAGRAVHAGDLQDAAEAGETTAQAVLDRAARFFAAGLRTVVATLDPARIVVVGSLLAEGATFGRLVRRHWSDVRPAWSTTDLLDAADDEDATLLGAARAAMHLTDR